MTEKNFRQKFLDTEIVSGHCPECHMYTIVVGLTRSYCRWTRCGFDVDQKFNGVIKNMKIVKETRMTFVNDGQD